jgi:hypothetical protein
MASLERIRHLSGLTSNSPEIIFDLTGLKFGRSTVAGSESSAQVVEGIENILRAVGPDCV